MGVTGYPEDGERESSGGLKALDDPTPPWNGVAPIELACRSRLGERDLRQYGFLLFPRLPGRLKQLRSCR
jgi:hypothetical protein